MKKMIFAICLLFLFTGCGKQIEISDSEQTFTDEDKEVTVADENTDTFENEDEINYDGRISIYSAKDQGFFRRIFYFRKSRKIL